MADFKYECNFCNAKFKLEARFLKHNCKEMKRDAEFRTTIGQAAWMYYQTWMKTGRKLVPQPKSFLHSRFYNSFIRFAHHVKKVHLPDVNGFIQFMRDHNMTPTMWTSDQVYPKYLEYLDRRSPPTKRASTTIDTLYSIAEAADVDVSEVFDVLDASDVITLLRRRSISPWILLHSTKFKQFFATRMTGQERIILESLIRLDFWTEKFTKNPKMVEMMKVFVEELKL